jgi:hypothetical protein
VDLISAHEPPLISVFEGYDKWINDKLEKDRTRIEKVDELSLSLSTVLDEKEREALNTLVDDLLKSNDQLIKALSAEELANEAQTFVTSSLDVFNFESQSSASTKLLAALQTFQQILTLRMTGDEEGADVSDTAFHPLRPLLDKIILRFQSRTIPPKLLLKQKVGKKIPITLNEDYLDESFVRGGGRGGQKINKTSSKVVLVHKPTGLQVQTQKTRSLGQHRRIARTMLIDRLDVFYNGGMSKSVVKGEVKKEKIRRGKARRKKTAERKRGEVNDDCEDDDENEDDDWGDDDDEDVDEDDDWEDDDDEGADRSERRS